MSLHPKIQLSKVRVIGWELWDPIGIRGMVSDDLRSGPADEYDNYLLKVVSLLTHGHSVEEASAYLDDIASNYMGLGPSNHASKAAARITAEAVAGYLRSLPDAPEALKP